MMLLKFDPFHTRSRPRSKLAAEEFGGLDRFRCRFSLARGDSFERRGSTLVFSPSPSWRMWTDGHGSYWTHTRTRRCPGGGSAFSFGDGRRMERPALPRRPFTS